MARPSKNNPEGKQKKYKKTSEVIGALKEAFRIGCTNAEACIHANIAESTFYEWMSSDQELSEKITRAKQYAILRARQTVVNNLSDINTAKWYLERKCKNEFATKSESKHYTDDGHGNDAPMRGVDVKITKKYVKPINTES